MKLLLMVLIILITKISIPVDRIEAGTYLAAAAITGGDLTISKKAPRMNNILDKLKLSGAEINIGNDDIKLSMNKDLFCQ